MPPPAAPAAPDAQGGGKGFEKGKGKGRIESNWTGEQIAKVMNFGFKAGVVVNWKEDKGFGFVKEEGSLDDNIFIHRRNLLDGMQELCKNDHIVFQTEWRHDKQKGEQRLYGTNVRMSKTVLDAPEPAAPPPVPEVPGGASLALPPAAPIGAGLLPGEPVGAGLLPGDPPPSGVAPMPADPAFSQQAAPWNSGAAEGNPNWQEASQPPSLPSLPAVPPPPAAIPGNWQSGPSDWQSGGQKGWGYNGGWSSSGQSGWSASSGAPWGSGGGKGWSSLASSWDDQGGGGFGGGGGAAGAGPQSQDYSGGPPPW